MKKSYLRTMWYTAVFLMFLSYLIPYNVVDPKLEPFEKEYMSYVNKYCTSDKYLVPIQKELSIGEADKNTIAYCITNNITKMKIVYNKYYWDYENEDSKFVTMAHELTHCMFGAPHVDDENNFMYAYDIGLSKETTIKQLEIFLKEKCK